MWTLRKPTPAKLIVGILAADEKCLAAARQALGAKLGTIDLASETWPFGQTEYYEEQTGENILRQFVSIESVIDPGKLAKVKHITNKIERRLARQLAADVPRPVNLDPGLIEPAKLVLATTKDYSHRVYIGKKIYAEVTLIYHKGRWQPLEYTYPDYKQSCYHEFFSRVRSKLLQQLRSLQP